MSKPDAWKLYCEAFRAMWPTASDVSSVVSPVALQEMVDRLLAQPEARETPVAWIASHGGGKAIHFAKADGWQIEVVQTEPQK